MRPGIWQLLIVLLIVIIIFGAKKIPELTRSLGRSVGEFKKGIKEGNAVAEEKVDEFKTSLKDEMDPDKLA